MPSKIQISKRTYALLHRRYGNTLTCPVCGKPIEVGDVVYATGIWRRRKYIHEECFYTEPRGGRCEPRAEA